MPAVSRHAIDDIAIITVDNPPVNALSGEVRGGILNAIEEAVADPSIAALVLICAGDTFIAGADISEFGKPAKSPRLAEVHQAMDASTKPIIAAMHGTVYGGGLETALACTGRVALPGTKFALPEVKLGILPGAGGTQRLPRVVGPERALDMILSGDPIDAKTAQDVGLVDEIVSGDLQDAAIAFARRAVGQPISRVKDRGDKIAQADPQLFADARAKVAKSARGVLAPVKIIECVEAACSLPFDEGMKAEAAALQECMESPQRAALVHLFFAERAARKIPELGMAKPRDIRSGAIVGAGTMGGGIAMCFANAGIPVTVLDVSMDALDRGRSVIEKNYAVSVKRGSFSEEAAASSLSRISYSTEYADIADCDIVIEAVFEDLDIKRNLFAKLDATMKSGAILATNTSTLDIDEIAAATSRPEAVCGTHFFSPANVMRLLENVRGAKSSPETLATAMDLGRRLGKVTVLAGNCDGFIANRMQAPYGNETDRLIEEGASLEQIDRVMTSFGFAMGPVAVRDLVGIDTSWRIRDQRRQLRPGSQPPTPLLDRIYAAGRMGQKTGEGYYRYEGRKALSDPAVEKMIADIALDMGVARKPVSDDEIRDRLMCALVNEAAKILEEGIALRAGDVDLAYVYGYGFPAWRGGPLHWAQSEGLQSVYDRISAFDARFNGSWRPSLLLKEAAEKGVWPR
ncbi:3-hydroxyacyl-CoA dehydrogenase NAD-binding domain-containing protein [Sphingobium sp. V4]|uniref:3-hydroxyacyl-CoA dehydrogenase NAD-binding domain-containing protein n=1 Tax=Sphingobium sp. V4 TaxID=3038927 RepID=UPI0025582CE8|nr:3-hydroxyacyl-CoA dehydrogenase NAD-binding domain-containing protein [Sphingobium sp. V4]WIW89537.1 3-hydroxyacyl-CoA dehydrogenase NAD-binding domain-containing protein [Sphingobium sp. V4]